MDKIRIGSILKDEHDQLYLVAEERDDCIPSFFTLQCLKYGHSIIITSDDEDFFTKVA
jgi:hypothetical protein